MLRLEFDIETDGLLDSLTRCHSLVIRDRVTGELLLSCTDDPVGREMGYASIAEGLAMLAEADVLYAHNGEKFDFPALRKLYPEWKPKGKLQDTLVIAQFRWAHIADSDYALARSGKFPAHLAGSHMLEAWGYRLGILKGDFGKKAGDQAWDVWTPSMQTYCEQDTLVTHALVLKIAKAGGISPLALEIEHKLARYLAYQERCGWPLDMTAVVQLQGTLAERREELANKLRDHFGFWYAPNGKPKVAKRTLNRKSPIPGVNELVLAGAEYQPIKRVEFNPASRAHIARCLMLRYGWKPLSFTPSGDPQVDETALKNFDSPISADLIEFLTVDKRLGQISEGKEAWLRHINDAGYLGGKLTGLYHIHHRCKQNQAVTHRAAHSNPNVAQVPKVGSEYGAECRACWTVPDGWLMLGADASGLELRCLAHYMAKYDDGAYGKAVVEGKNEDGTDVHSKNRDALGLSGKKGRDEAKTFIYAFLYGSGPYNLGDLIGVTAEDIELYKTTEKKLWSRMVQYNEKQGYPTDDKGIAKSVKGSLLKARFLKNTPALAELIKAVKDKVPAPGYLMMPDGRRTYIRHAHAALNSLLQSAGAIICKLWIVRFADKLYDRFGEPGWDGLWVPLGWIHDEVQLAVRPEIADEVGRILVETIIEVGEELGWRCPLDGEAKTGRNWMETH